MTFQRECEKQDRPKCLIKHTKEAKNNEPATQQIQQTSSATNAPQTSSPPNEDATGKQKDI